MSYCRWSSDNFASDVYVYEYVHGGFNIHVAGNRIVGNVPPLPNILEVGNDEFVAAHRRQMDFVRSAKHAPIGLPHDGETFNEPDIPATIARLLELRAAGYIVPEYALEALREEMQSSPTQDSTVSGEQ